MWTSVPQMPARRTRIRTSSSRIVGSGTLLSVKPGPAVSLTSALTRDVLQMRERRRPHPWGRGLEKSPAGAREGSAERVPLVARLRERTLVLQDAVRRCRACRLDAHRAHLELGDAGVRIER